MLRKYPDGTVEKVTFTNYGFTSDHPYGNVEAIESGDTYYDPGRDVDRSYDDIIRDSDFEDLDRPEVNGTGDDATASNPDGSSTTVVSGGDAAEASVQTHPAKYNLPPDIDDWETSDYYTYNALKGDAAKDALPSGVESITVGTGSDTSYTVTYSDPINNAERDLTGIKSVTYDYASGDTTYVFDGSTDAQSAVYSYDSINDSTVVTTNYTPTEGNKGLTSIVVDGGNTTRTYDPSINDENIYEYREYAGGNETLYTGTTTGCTSKTVDSETGITTFSYDPSVSSNGITSKVEYGNGLMEQTYQGDEPSHYYVGANMFTTGDAGINALKETTGTIYYAKDADSYRNALAKMDVGDSVVVHCQYLQYDAGADGWTVNHFKSLTDGSVVLTRTADNQGIVTGYKSTEAPYVFWDSDPVSECTDWDVWTSNNSIGDIVW